jgi:hypothetical protein
MQMGDDAGSGIKPCESDWPGQTRAKIRIVAVVQCRHGDELGGTVLLAPLENLTQADVTALAGWILDRTAGCADLKRETPVGRCERDRHVIERASTAAPVHSPRS